MEEGGVSKSKGRDGPANPNLWGRGVFQRGGKVFSVSSPNQGKLPRRRKGTSIPCKTKKKGREKSTAKLNRQRKGITPE